MTSLERAMASRISREGPLTFRDFMEEALYRPGLGYYTSPETEIGRAGDFYTSPHLHRIFGAMLGRQAEEMWKVMGRPGRFEVLEIGAGRGYLCSDMLDYLKGSVFYDHLAYIIVEINPALREKQEALLCGHQDKVSWHSELGDVGVLKGLVLSNELLDAMPVHLVEMQKAGLREIYVGTDGSGNFIEQSGPPSTDAIGEYLEEFGVSLPPGYRTEVNLDLRNWVGRIDQVLQEGFVLTIDYGYPADDYYSEERSRGTLMCYHRHQEVENPLVEAGRQDITAHVNFSALKRWGEEYGLMGLGFCRQGLYLVALGIDEMIARLHADSTDYEREITLVKGLIMPGTMGDTHKVMVQYKGTGIPELRGFSFRNQLDRP